MSKGFVIFIGILGLAMLGSTCSSKKPKTEAEIQNEKISVAPFTCERLVKNYLRDPESYQRISVNSFKTDGRVKGVDYMAKIEGRAKNGFGGYAATSYSCLFSFNSDKVQIIKN